MEEVKREKKIKAMKEIKPKRIKKIKVQNNNVIIRYDPNNIHVDLIKYKYIRSKIYLYIFI